ncbi:MAG TPA: VWA domain-containing protein [Ignavibacteriaceae bacterium]|nr:VWA domain-containing protein [Ignavibacteriaceae bacterium]
MSKLLLVLMLVCASLIYFSCDTAETPADQNTDIPADPSGVTVPTPVHNNVLPSASFTSDGNRVKLNLTGLIDPTSNQPITLFYDASNPAASNIFVEEDGVVQGLKVSKVSTGNVLTADIVFCVDNSGSMGEEADSVAASIIQFATFLQSSGLDVKFAVVGFGYGDVDGGINFTDAASISNYLNRYTGTDRTIGFSGSDSAAIENRAYSFGYATDENDVIASIFADSVYSWRAGAQRVFINFTDEPTQSDGAVWNNAMGCDLLSGKATVHTVFSGDTTYYNNSYWDEYNEEPAALSRCTGGTVKYIPENALGLNLSDLPVAGALANSYLVEFVTANTGVSHTVKITIFTSTADGSQTFTVTY